MKIQQHAKAEDSWSSYLHSHLVAAAAGERLFGNAAKTWKDTAEGESIARLRDEVRADKDALHGIAEALGMGIPAYKKPIAWAGKFLGSLGPINPLHARTGAAEQLELEALISAVTGKSLLWKTLALVSRTEPRITQEQLTVLQERAAAQLRELEGLLLRTAPERFTHNEA
jgi:hypothetical protein